MDQFVSMPKLVWKLEHFTTKSLLPISRDSLASFVGKLDDFANELGGGQLRENFVDGINQILSVLQFVGRMLWVCLKLVYSSRPDMTEMYPREADKYSLDN